MSEKMGGNSRDWDRIFRTNTGVNLVSLHAIRSSHGEFDKLFKILINKLDRFFPIEKASLAFYDQQSHRLRVTHIYDHGTMKSGMSLNFPPGNSAMYQVLLQGYPVADNYPDHMTNSVLEKKILMSTLTRSVLIAPLVLKGSKLGLLSLASQKESAFGLYINDVGTDLVADFVLHLGRALNSYYNIIS